MNAIALRRTAKATLPTPQTRLTSTWVKVVGTDGQVRMEMRWSSAPFVTLSAA